MLTSHARPGVIVTQIFPAADAERGGTVAALDTIAAEDFFEAVMVAPVRDVGERRDVAALTAGGPTLTYCLIPPMADAGLSLSSLDEGLRRRSVDAVLALLDEALEVGARRVMVGSGPAPSGEEARTRALAQLTVSLDEACAAAAARDMRVVIEPLDVAIHKKQTLGYTPEAIDLAHAMARHEGAFALCLDTSHMTLNAEDIVACVEQAGPLADTLHFCNCVTDPTEPLYGDHHPPLGPPGYLDVPEMARLMREAVRVGFLGPDRRIEVVVEELNRPGDVATGVSIMRAGREALEAAWELAGVRS